MSFDLTNPATRILDRLADTTYVLMIEIDGKPTLVLEPGTNTIYRVQNKQVAESYASTIQREEGVKCGALTWREAWRILSKDSKTLANLEKDLLKRMDRNLQRNTGAPKSPDAN